MLKAIAKKASGGDVVANPVKLDRALTAAGGSLTSTAGASPCSTTRSRSRARRRTTSPRPSWPAGGANMGEKLTAETDQLFAAIRTERIDEFLLNHPNFLNSETAVKKAR
ncbi:hypothetical protein GCM10022251_81400 [Phytohabitans flavus]|uniref:hypothetical protein n=1 Tax=Phytohabitans flavus TaxID=1076124 RepID=UPI0015636B99|nr:hypothetical protein [Phytohabitans flavus]